MPPRSRGNLNAPGGNGCAWPRRSGSRAEVIRQRFGVDYTLPGLDPLLHRLSWSGRVPARQLRSARAADRRLARGDLAGEQYGGGPGLAGLRGRVRPGAKAAEGPHLDRRGRTPVVRVTAQNGPRLSLAALVAVKPGHRPRL